MKLFSVLIILASLFSCSEKEDIYIEWSVKMAGSVMDRNDSLTKAMGRKDVWQYDYAVLAGAIGKLSENTSDPKYFKYMKDYVDYYITEDGTIKFYRLEEYNLDKIRPAVNIFTLYQKTGEEKYKKSLVAQNEQMKTHPRTNDGGFWHKKVYQHQMWLDGVYMSSPFMAEYAHTFNEPQWYDEVVKQITQIYAHTRDEKTGLLYHAWDESRQQLWCDTLTGKSKHFWSRAVGWYVMAIVDVLDYLPENHAGYPKVVSILNDVSSALLKVQDSNSGLWYQVLDMGGREGNYLEASGSSMFIYAFAKGVRKGYLPASYMGPAEKGFNGLVNNLIVKDSDGLYSLTQTCGGCGLGGNPYRDGSYEYYVNEKIMVNDPKGLGPFILAGIEMSEAKAN